MANQYVNKTLYLLPIFAFLSLFGFSQNEDLKPVVIFPVYFDVSPPLRDMAGMAPGKSDHTWKDGIVKNFFNVRKKVQDRIPNYTDPEIQDYMGLVPTDTTIQNFDGIANPNGYIPPDTHGDVGPNHYFQVVNASYKIFNKTGTGLLGPLNNSSVFTGLPNNSNDGDAVVLYDEQANRWLFTQFSLPNYPAGPFFQMIAVSQTPDPTGSWYRWEYQFTDMPDYPKFGIWPDGYYMSMNRFTATYGSYAGTGAVAYDRTAMIAGNANPAMVLFTLGSSNEAFSLLPSDCDGAFPAAGTPNYYTYIYDGSPNHLGILEFHVNWTTPASSTFGSLLSLPVNSFSNSISGVPQKNTSKQLDVINDRLMYRLQYRKFSGYQAMVCNHTVNATSSVSGIRWYELRKTTGAWAIYQQGTYSPDNNSRWMGSMAMDTSGNIALGYSISSSTMFPAIRYTGRMAADPLGTMTITEKGICNGGGSQTGGGTPGRWGDYSAMSCDPSSPGTFWYTTEYFATQSSTNWKTRIASFSFINILNVTATATPSNINSGQTSQLNVTATGGTGVYTYSWTSLPAGFTSGSQNPVVSPTVTTKYIAHVTSGTLTKTDTTEVFINMAVVATANPYTINSGQSSQLNVTATGATGTYTYSWTSVPAGFTSTLQNPVVTPTVTTKYTALATSGTQSLSDTALVTVGLTVLATANPPSITPGSPSQLNAVATGGSGTYTYVWTSVPPGFNSTQQSPVVYPLVTTQYIVVANDGSQSKSDTALVTVSQNPLIVTATATPAVICQGQISQLNVNATGGSTTYTYSWTSNPPGFNSNIQNPVVQPTQTTDYIATVHDGTQVVTDTTKVTVLAPPTGFAGNDTTYCSYITEIPLEGTASNYSSVYWATSGDGTFSNNSTPASIYYPGTGDKTNAYVNLTLTAYPLSPCVATVSSTRHILFDPCTGISEQAADIFDLGLRPNPTDGIFTLSLSGMKNKEARVEIMDLTGKVIFRQTIGSSGRICRKTLDISGYPKGIYFLQARLDGQVRTTKIIVQ
jgi:hypothetical protein